MFAFGSEEKGQLEEHIQVVEIHEASQSAGTSLRDGFTQRAVDEIQKLTDFIERLQRLTLDGDKQDENGAETSVPLNAADVSIEMGVYMRLAMMFLYAVASKPEARFVMADPH